MFFLIICIKASSSIHIMIPKTLENDVIKLTMHTGNYMYIMAIMSIYYLYKYIIFV